VNKIRLTLLTLLLPIAGFSQITISNGTLTFPKTEYNKVSDQLLNIVNDYAVAVNVTIRSHNKDFYVDDSIVEVKANSRSAVTVHFKPTHNINYNSEIVVVSSTKTGSIAVDVKGSGQYSSYYTSTFDLSEEDLKKELKSIVSSGYKNLGYNGARDAMYGSIDNKSGKVECVYTGRQATFNTRSGANSNSFNCEHTWPQSLFNKNEPERADIHHLFPTDVNSNSRRSNYPFGVVTSASWSEGGSKQGGGKFEPRDAHKGDCARAMFYFAIRYQNYSSFLNSQESILRSWATSHPPTQHSIDRNNAIFTYQKNRNPFADYPEFMDRITSISANSSAPTKHVVVPSVPAITISSLITAAQFEYNLVLTNTGNQRELFTGFGNGNANVTFPKTAFEIAPGESHTLKVSITPTANAINDEIQITSSDVTLKIPVMITGLSNIDQISRSKMVVSLYPEVLRVSGVAGSKLTLYDAKGKIVYFNEIQSDFTEIETSSFAGGLYFVEAIGGNLVPQVQKVLIP